MVREAISWSLGHSPTKPTQLRILNAANVYNHDMVTHDADC